MPNTLTLLRRHRPACQAGRPADSYSTEAEERRHNFAKCRCKIYAHGTLSGVFKKFATGARDWDRAREAVAPYLQAGRWDLPGDPPPPPAPAPAPAASGLAIADAVQASLAAHAAEGDAPNTVKKYTEVLGQFARFSQSLGLRYLHEWDRSHVRQLMADWRKQGNCPLTVTKKLGLLKPFFEPYLEDGILLENPARIRTRTNRASRLKQATTRQVNPFTDEELARMFAACAALSRGQVVSINRLQRGEDLADFIHISCATGLRISDVATFDIARLTSQGEVNLRATKNGNWVSVWIPEWLRERIRTRAARVGRLIFGTHSTTDLNVITACWRYKLNRLWAKCGPWEEKPTPHRFRHTFVRILLERGVAPSVIADLAGDTEQMIRKHYSAWMPGRQEQTSRMLEEAFRHVPRFHYS